MSTAGLQQVIEATVDEKVHNDEMFTAHDVTLTVRNKGHRAKHNEIRDGVHDYFTRGGMGIAYTRTAITVPGGTPYLYHRLVDDPATYGNIRGGAGQSGPAAINVPPPTAQNDDDDDSLQAIDLSNIFGPAGVLSTPAVATSPRQLNKPNSKIARAVDARGVLSIPAGVLRSSDFKPLSKAYVSAPGNKTVEITKTKPAVPVVGEYTVDRHCQVRVCPNFLRAAAIDGGKYDIEASRGRVVVKLHK